LAWTTTLPDAVAWVTVTFAETTVTPAGTPQAPETWKERETPAAVVQALAELTGRMPLPPKWALGFQQSRWGYSPDDRAREIFDLMGRNLGVGIANIINFFDPQAVIINGGIAAARETITEKMKESIDNFVVSPAARSTPIIFSELGRFGGAIGAALLAESLIKSALISSSAGVKN